MADNFETLLDHLVELCDSLAMDRRVDTKRLFELTKSGDYPEPVARLAEAFGMMLVKVEAREYRLEQMVEELTRTRDLLSQARARLTEENESLKDHLRRQFGVGGIIGTSPRMVAVLEQVKRIADLPVNVLICGETGTGKELVAKALHFGSRRNAAAFVAINCSAIPEQLFESELFGIEKGVATGVERRMGRIEQSSGGTLFLDEIGDMPMAGQAKILRAVEDGEITRVGGRKPAPVDLRIVAATNKDIPGSIEKDEFRSDLYYRLNVVRLDLPPLREREGDIPLLAKAFLDKYGRVMRRGPMALSPEAMAMFETYAWPGNVRELENEVERAVALAVAEEIGPRDLSDTLRKGVAGQGRSAAGASKGALKCMERDVILQTLTETDNNKAEAARRLGISREGLRKKMKRLGLA